jgi:uncharacterized protein
MTTFDVEPRINGDIHFGHSLRTSVILAGRVAEKGVGGNVFFDGSDNFVVFEVGKRGSGKSYGMGALLEGFATVEDSTAISKHTERRGILLLDPLDIHWTALIPLSDSGPSGLRRQHAVLKKWKNLEAEAINVRVWVPAGYEWDIDHPEFRPYYLPVSAFEANDWALLLSTDLILDTRGRLIDEAYQKVARLGWKSSGIRTAPREDYGIQDLIDCISKDDEITQFYHAETIRSVVQPLQSFGRMELFSARSGTPMVDLVKSGILSILCLARLSESLRTVLTAVLVRKLYQDRSVASQINRRLQLQAISGSEKDCLEAELERHVPKTILAIDEAQILMPARGGDLAKQALNAYVLQGRAFGLSLWLATQRPKGAVSEAAVSQIDTFIVHRLSVADDIAEVSRSLQNATPDKMRLNGREITLSELIRSLDVGQAIISSASSEVPRFVIVSLRPRMVAHGGEAF